MTMLEMNVLSNVWVISESRENLMIEMKAKSNKAAGAKLERKCKKSEKIKEVAKLEKVGALKKFSKEEVKKLVEEEKKKQAGKHFTKKPSATSEMTAQKKTKRGIATTLDEGSTRQPSKGKIYGRKYDGRFASKATYKYHSKKYKGSSSRDNGNTSSVSHVKPKGEKTGDKEKRKIVDGGSSWRRMDKYLALKVLEALRWSPHNPPPTTAKTNEPPDERSFREINKVSDTYYPYDDLTEDTHPLPLTSKSTPTCNKDFCNLGCICTSLNGAKKMIKRDHCGHHQCMFSCHCQHMTRSKAPLFESLSPIMDAKFSFFDLNNSNPPAKKTLLLDVDEKNSKVLEKDSGKQNSQESFTEDSSQPSSFASKPKARRGKNAGQKCIRKSDRIKDRSLYSSIMQMEYEEDLEDMLERGVLEDNQKKKRCKSKKKSSPSTKMSGSESMEIGNEEKSAPVYLEISSDSEEEKVRVDHDGSPQLPKKQRFDESFDSERAGSSANESSSGGSSIGSASAKSVFKVEHLMIRNPVKVNGVEVYDNLLVEVNSDCEWREQKNQLSNLLYRLVFKQDGINRINRDYIWSSFRISLSHITDRESIPMGIKNQVKVKDVEFIRLKITLNDISPSKAILIPESPVKATTNEPGSEETQTDKTDRDAIPATSNKENSVIVVEDESDEAPESPNSSCDLITNVASLAPVACASSAAAPPPFISTPFSNATGISGCRQFMLNVISQYSPVSCVQTPLRSTSPRSLVTPSNCVKIGSSTPLSADTLDKGNKDLDKRQAQHNLQQSLSKSVSPIHAALPSNSVPFQRTFASLNTLPKVNLSPSDSTSVLIAPTTSQNTDHSVSPRSSNLPRTSPTMQPAQSDLVSPVAGQEPHNSNINNNNNNNEACKVSPKSLLWSQQIKTTSADPKRVIVLKPLQANQPQRFIVIKNPQNHLKATKSILVTPPHSLLKQKSPILSPFQKDLLIPSTPLLSKPHVILPNLVKNEQTSEVVSTAIEIYDSDEDREAKNRNQQHTQREELDDILKSDEKLDESTKNADESVFQAEKDGPNLLEECSRSNCSETGSVSSQSEDGDERHISCASKLKTLYQEIVKTVGIKEERTKISVGEILGKAFETVSNLQSKNSWLANELFDLKKANRKYTKQLMEFEETVKQTDDNVEVPE